MAFFLPSPRAVVELSRYAAGQVVESAAAAATIPMRVLNLLSQAELAASRISLVAQRADALIDRVSCVVDEADEAMRRTAVVMAAASVAVQEATTVAAAAAEVIDGAGAVSARAAVLIEDVTAVSAQAAALVDGAGAVSARAATLVDDSTAVAARAALVMQEAELVSGAAAEAVRQVTATAKDADDLLEDYAPTLRKAAPLAARFVDELTAEEVTAAIRMIDELPRLRHHLANDVMPLLGKLDRVGPDLHSLLEVTRDLHLAIAGIPGLRMLRRRGEQKLDDEDTAADEQ